LWIVCQWGFTPGREQMVAGCILGMVSSSVRNPTTCLANERDQPEKVSVVRPLEELTLAYAKGEIIWHEEE